MYNCICYQSQNIINKCSVLSELTKIGRMKGDSEDMGMLKSISLENYKCFEKLIVEDNEKLEIAPLTILCGVNSSGKSSIIKSLLMLKQSFENNQTKGQLVFAGDYVDNGSFKDVVYNNKGDSFTLGNSFILSISDKELSDKRNFTVDKSNFKELNRIYKYILNDLNINKCGYEIRVTLTIAGEDNPKTQIQAIRNHFLQYVIDINLFSGNDKIIFSSSIFIEKMKNGLCKINFKNFPLFSTDYGSLFMNEEIYDCHCYFDGLKIIKIFSDKPSRQYNMNDFLPNLYTIFSIISEQYTNIKHISPLRYLQNRRYTLTSGIRDMSPNGEDVLQLLAQYGTKSINLFKINENDEFYFSEKETLMDAAKWWSSYMQTGELELFQKEELLKLNVSGHNIIDVGVGVGQSIPIIVDGLYSIENSVIMVEQPEIHLHPMAQMSMADFLLSLSLNNKTVIVETHSDHIINRLVKRIMKDVTGELNRCICIYFIDKNSDKQIEKITIDPTRGIVNAPTNFFTQFASETMLIAKTGYNNHKEGIIW